MKDAFGVDRTDISKGWKGEPGDKRNTKYAAATALSPIATVGYGIYRQTDSGKRRRAASIKAKKQVSKAWKGESGDKRNTKYAGSWLAGDVTGSAIGRSVGSGGKDWKKSRDHVRSAQLSAFTSKNKRAVKSAKYTKDVELLNRTGRGGMVGGLAGGSAAAAAYYVHRHSDGGQKSIARSIKTAKKK